MLRELIHSLQKELQSLTEQLPIARFGVKIPTSQTLIATTV